MTEKARNFFVGVTVLVGLGMLAGVILLFTGLPGFFSSGYDVKIYIPDTYSIRAGEPVYLYGMKVGTITDVSLSGEANSIDGDSSKRVVLTARIDEKYLLPGDVRLHLSKGGMSNQPYLEFTRSGSFITDADGKQLDFYPTDPPPVIELVYDRGGGLLPPQLTKAMESLGTVGEQIGPAMVEFSKLARNLNNLIAPEHKPGTNANNGNKGENGNDQQEVHAGGLANSLANLDKALSGIAVFFGDPENQANFSKTLKDLAVTAEAAKGMMSEVKLVVTEFRDVVKEASKAVSAAGVTAETTTEKVEELSESMLTQIEKLSALLSTLHKAATKIESGKGTAGKLLNDPELYNSLSEAAGELSSLTAELRLLVAKWKKEGLGIKLK